LPEAKVGFEATLAKGFPRGTLKVNVAVPRKIAASDQVIVDVPLYEVGETLLNIGVAIDTLLSKKTDMQRVPHNFV
jgi:hypothetical protein